MRGILRNNLNQLNEKYVLEGVLICDNHTLSIGSVDVLPIIQSVGLDNRNGVDTNRTNCKIRITIEVLNEESL